MAFRKKVQHYKWYLKTDQCDLLFKWQSFPDLNSIRQDIVSKLWFTYRKDFIPIGGSDGKTSDKGWGCMLRCGQMVLGQALITLHLGLFCSFVEFVL